MRRGNPPHVHIARDRSCAKFWLDPVRLQATGGFALPEVWRIAKLVGDNREVLHLAWIEFFEDADNGINGA